MKESINVNKKGDTDVKSEDTILYRPNFFDAREADVLRPGPRKSSSRSGFRRSQKDLSRRPRI